MSWLPIPGGDDYDSERRRYRLVESVGAVAVVLFFCLLFVGSFFLLKFGVVTVLPLAGYQTTFGSGWLVTVSMVSLTVTIWTTFRLSDRIQRAKYRYLAD
ncbi:MULTISPECIES: hypothetical protein [Salinibaculum]|uniref:hypothetical protein n=1 Tax=Salinibaculum TaxID=2732368 RepID=UPI0030D19718